MTSVVPDESRAARDGADRTARCEVGTYLFDPCLSFGEREPALSNEQLDLLTTQRRDTDHEYGVVVAGNGLVSRQRKQR